MSLADRVQPDAGLLPEDVRTLELVVDAGRGLRISQVSKRLGRSIEESVAVMSRLHARGLVDYNLTTGYTVTRAGLREAQEMDEDSLQETGTFSASVGGRAPAQIHGASTATGAMTPERAKKLKRLAQERERARERLRELAQESRGLPRRPLRTLGA